MTPSKYQSAVLAAVLGDSCNLMVQAVAGSGKTATLKMICEEVTKASPRTDILALAFNKEIAETLGKKLPPSVTCKTMHSLGWGIIRDNWSGCRIDKDREKQAKAAAAILGEKRKLTPMMKKYSEALVDLVAKIRNTDTELAWPAIEGMATEYDVDLEAMFEVKRPIEITADATKMAELLREDKTTIDFDDMLDMPVFHELTGRQQFDLILVDESQDLNRLQARFLGRLLHGRAPVTDFGGLDDLLAEVGVKPLEQKAKPNRPTTNRVVLVGDVRQAIYKFRGADSQAMNNLAAEFETKRLPLSICYRCPKAVISLAQEIVGPEIEASPTAEEGTVNFNAPGDLASLMGGLKPGAMVVCRTNAPLLKLALQTLRGGKKVSIRGRNDLGANLIKLIGTVRKRAPKETLASFNTELETYIHEQITKCIDEDKIKLADLWSDKYECLSGIARDVTSVDEMSGFLNRIFEDEPTDGVIFSSIHRAKGLEADHTIIVQPEKLPHPMAYKANNVESAVEQERNLTYVAVTRAMKELTLQPLPEEIDSPFPELQKALAEAAVRRASMGHMLSSYGGFIRGGRCQAPPPTNFDDVMDI
jgi:DNA helicase-2/ATP-dependent DNA helicase PcrA